MDNYDFRHYDNEDDSLVAGLEIDIAGCTRIIALPYYYTNNVKHILIADVAGRRFFVLF